MNLEVSLLKRLSSFTVVCRTKTENLLHDWIALFVSCEDDWQAEAGELKQQNSKS